MAKIKRKVHQRQAKLIHKMQNKDEQMQNDPKETQKETGKDILCPTVRGNCQEIKNDHTQP